MQEEQNNPQFFQCQNSPNTEQIVAVENKVNVINKKKEYQNKDEAKHLIEMFLDLHMLIKQFDRKEKFSSIFYEIANKLSTALDELRETQGIEKIQKIQQKKVLCIMEILSAFLYQQKRSLIYQKDRLKYQKYLLSDNSENIEINNPEEIKNYFENLFLFQNNLWTEQEKNQLIPKIVASVMVETDNTRQNIKNFFISNIQFGKLGERINKNFKGIFFLRKNNICTVKPKDQLIEELVARLMCEAYNTPQNSKNFHRHFGKFRKDFKKKIKYLFFICPNNFGKKHQKKQTKEKLTLRR